MVETANSQLAQIESVHVKNDMLHIQFRGEMLKLSSGVDIDTAAGLFGFIQSL